MVEIPTTSSSAAVRFTEIDDAGDERVEGWNGNDQQVHAVLSAAVAEEARG